MRIGNEPNTEEGNRNKETASPTEREAARVRERDGARDAMMWRQETLTIDQ